MGALDVGYKAGIGDLSKIKFLYLLGAVSSDYPLPLLSLNLPLQDSGQLKKESLPKDCFVVYQGTTRTSLASMFYVLSIQVIMEIKACLLALSNLMASIQKSLLLLRH